MARENAVWMHGQVRDIPKVYIDGDGNPYKAMFIVRVMRRPMVIPGKQVKLYIDCPVVMTKNADRVKEVSTLQQGDMVDIRGVVSSKEVRKSSICPFCGNKNLSDGNIVYITPLYICKREHATEEEGIEFLKQRSEISNIVNVIGNLCREPEFHEDEKHRQFAQYQLAVNRRFHIKEDADDVKTDYPWVKTFGRQATDDSTCLHTGSSVYISGALQTRDINRTIHCDNEECGQEYSRTDTVAEIVPYYIGYLAHCDVPQRNTDVDSVDSETAETEGNINGEETERSE